MGRVTKSVAKMEKIIGPIKTICIAITGVVLIMLVWGFSPFTSHLNMFDAAKMTELPESDGAAVSYQGLNLGQDPADQTFYDDPDVSYMVGRPVKNWDEKRREWLKHHPSFAAGAKDRVLVLTSSQPGPCENSIGDHLNLRLFKNKVDYCRLHGYDIFYNNAFLHPEMGNWWAKVPAVRATMVAHPEVEWIFWVDSDAIFTDMDFKPPLEKYKDYNLVVDGWPDAVFEKKSWVGLNAGVFLLRNCQWSMEFLEAWAEMGPQSPNYENWGKVQMETLNGKTFPQSDDQSGIIYLMLKDKKWRNKMHIETQYDLSGYWPPIVESFEKIIEHYTRIEKKTAELQRRHAEKVSEHYAEALACALRMEGGSNGAPMRPFTTHFTGCQQCTAEYKPDNACLIGMQKALNFADNQVLRNYGFVRPNLQNSSFLQPLP